MTFSIFSHTAESYVSAIQSLLGKGGKMAELLYKRWYREGVFSVDEAAFPNSHSLQEEIKALTDFSLPLITSLLEEEGTRKISVTFSDGCQVQMVLLSMQEEKTLCISSQMGCRQGCLFCQTARMGFRRNLSRAEIVSQVFVARHHLNTSFRNLVFMGMGEPFDNYDEVVGAISILTDPRAFGIGPRRITLSTSGRLDGIERFIEEKKEINLAISLNAASDSLRKELMPVAAAHHDLKAIRKMLEELTRQGRRVLISYILIAKKNDSIEDAKRLSDYLRDLDVTINLIPFNPIEKWEARAPLLEEQRAFKKFLRDQGYRVFLRNTKGQKIMAGCGQLGKEIE